MNYRKPEKLSYSALACWEENPDEFFHRYICPDDVKPDKPPQTDPMSVGSAFDALVKNALYRIFYGEDKTVEDGYRIRDLVAKQCQGHTLPESLVIACDCWDRYVTCGAFGNLVAQINKSSVAPRMEFDVIKTIGGVPLLGKPDLHYRTTLHAHVIADFKVSGSCSNWGVSPQQGYATALDVAGGETSHRKYEPIMHPGGIWVNKLPMNETTDYWADQLSTYAWCLGEPVGSQDFVVRIEQLACRPPGKTATDDRLKIKCCTHQSTVSADHQFGLLERYQKCWDAVQRNHIWADYSLEESQARGEVLTRALTDGGHVVPAPTLEDVSEIDFSF